MVASCWHCKGTRICDCIGCGKPGAVALSWLPGKCIVCPAVEFNERHRAVLDASDTMDPKNWEYYPPHDGNKARRVFKPFKGLA